MAVHMNKKKISLVLIACLFVVFVFVLGTFIEKRYNFLSMVKAQTSGSIPWDSLNSGDWKEPFKDVEIASSNDGSVQNAIFLKSNDKAPLIVSLHTWSGDYKQGDLLAERIKEEGWNYIHPNYRGANNTPDACLSDLVISDIDDAIDYAVKNGNVDEDNIFVIGVSGGGYTSLGYYLKNNKKIKAFQSWVPISDLEQWHGQSVSRGQKYSIDIEKCSAGKSNDLIDGMKKGSPLNWNVNPDKLTKLDIFAGINDGYIGSVPVSHSINFYNKLANEIEGGNQVSLNESMEILSRGLTREIGKIGDRNLLFKKESPNISISIFDGGHEMIIDHTMKRIKELSN